MAIKKKNKDKTVVVVIQDGLVEVHNVPKGINVIIRDYDVDGADPERLKEDPDGKLCFEREINENC